MSFSTAQTLFIVMDSGCSNCEVKAGLPKFEFGASSSGVDQAPTSFSVQGVTVQAEHFTDAVGIYYDAFDRVYVQQKDAIVAIKSASAKISYDFNGVIGYADYIVNADAAKQIDHAIFSVYIPPGGGDGSVMVGAYSEHGVAPGKVMQVLKTSGSMTWDTTLVKVEYNGVKISDIFSFKSTAVLIDPAY